MEKQIIYLARGEGRGGEGREKGKGHSFQPFLPSPPDREGLIPRPPPHTEWGTEYHCLSLLTVLKGQA